VPIASLTKMMTRARVVDRSSLGPRPIRSLVSHDFRQTVAGYVQADETANRASAVRWGEGLHLLPAC